MTQLTPRQNDASPGQVYFDLTASNFQSTTSSPPVFEFNEARVSLYTLSILRFTVDSTPNQGDSDLTIYSDCPPPQTRPSTAFRTMPRGTIMRTATPGSSRWCIGRWRRPLRSSRPKWRFQQHTAPSSTGTRRASRPSCMPT
jgi:hypothetical protein